MSGVVWVSADRRRAFLIPGGQALPPGELELGGARGETRYVDEDAARACEVSLAEAEAALEAQARGLYEQVREQVGELLVTLRFAGALRWADGEARGLGDLPLGGTAEDLLDQLRGRFEPRPAEGPDAGRGGPEAAGPDPSRAGEPGADWGAGPRPEDLLADTAREVGDRLRRALSSPEVTQAISALGSRLQELASSLTEAAAPPPPPERPRAAPAPDDEDEP